MIIVVCTTCIYCVFLRNRRDSFNSCLFRNQRKSACLLKDLLAEKTLVCADKERNLSDCKLFINLRTFNLL